MSFFQGFLFFKVIIIGLFYHTTDIHDPKHGPDADFSTYAVPKNDQLTAEIEMLLKQIPMPVLNGEPVQKDWYFTAGDPGEGLIVDFSAKTHDEERVNLPIVL